MSLPEPNPIDDFNRQLDAMLRGEEPVQDGLSQADREALDLARRLTVLNPSLESRLRYPLRRALIQQAGHEVGSPARKSFVSGLRLLPRLSLAFAVVFILTWTFSGLNGTPSSGRPALPTSYNRPVEIEHVGEPPTTIAVQDFAPQPIPTPLAPRRLAATAPDATAPGAAPLGAALTNPSQTPAQDAQENPTIGLLPARTLGDFPHYP